MLGEGGEARVRLSFGPPTCWRLPENASTKLGERERITSSSTRCGWKSGYQGEVFQDHHLQGPQAFQNSPSGIEQCGRTGTAPRLGPWFSLFCTTPVEPPRKTLVHNVRSVRRTASTQAKKRPTLPTPKRAGSAKVESWDTNVEVWKSRYGFRGGGLEGQ